MTITGVIQAGGRSTRMGGRTKALLAVGGRAIVERVVAALRPAVDELLLVTNTPDLYAFLGFRMVPDVFPDHGSLGGIYSGLDAAATEHVFTVACDMPFLDSAVARLVAQRAPEADIVIPRIGGQLETLHAAYSKACLPHMEAQLLAHRLKITGFFDSVRVLEIPEAEIARLADPGVVFMNVNTPEELARAEAIAAERA